MKTALVFELLGLFSDILEPSCGSHHQADDFVSLWTAVPDAVLSWVFPSLSTSLPFPAPSQSCDPLCCGLLSAHPAYPTELHLTKTSEVSSRLGLAFRMKTKESPFWPSRNLRSSLVYFSSRIFCLVLSCVITSTQIIFPSSSRSCPFSSARGYFRAPGKKLLTS